MKKLLNSPKINKIPLRTSYAYIFETLNKDIDKYQLKEVSVIYINPQPISNANINENWKSKLTGFQENTVNYPKMKI